MFTGHIEPIQGFGCTASKIRISIINYQLFCKAFEVYYGLLDNNGNTIIENRVVMEESDFASWGTDDMELVNACIVKINSTISNISIVLTSIDPEETPVIEPEEEV